MARSPNVDLDWSSIRTAILCGLSFRSLAQQLGVPASTLLSRAKRECWNVKQSRQLIRQEKQQAGLCVAAAVTRTLTEIGHETRAALAEATLCAVHAILDLPQEQVLQHTRQLKDLAVIGDRLWGWSQDGTWKHANATFDVRMLAIRPIEKLADETPTLTDSASVEDEALPP